MIFVAVDGDLISTRQQHRSCIKVSKCHDKSSWMGAGALLCQLERILINRHWLVLQLKVLKTYFDLRLFS